MDARDPLDPRSHVGLSEREAGARLAAEGPNELRAARARSAFAIALEVVREPMFLLLLACGALYLTLGDLEEALTLLGFVGVVMGITIVEERKTERAVGALRDLSSPRALVCRDGQLRRVAGRDVARGDVVLLTEGDRVPADGALLASMNLQIDESLLTGESLAVRKLAASSPPSAMGAPGGDDSPYAFSSTLVVRGTGVLRVLAIGEKTEVGKLGAALGSLEPGPTRVQREVRRLVKVFAIGGVILCTVVLVTYGVTRHDWLHGLLAGLTLAMAVLPEEFPVVLTVFFALGAWRLAKQRVLARRVAAIEALGSATVLCVDKTGTLTENKMAIRRLWPGARGEGAHERTPRSEPLPESVHELVEFGILASQRDPFDPMELAFHELGNRELSGTEHLHASWTLQREYPLSPELLALSHVWRSPEGGRYVVAAKGAPEAIVDLCHLDPDTVARVLAAASELAGEGLRVLGVARAWFEGELPAHQHAFAFELVGLVGLADPVRSGVAGAIADCHHAGLRVMMLTGDYPETARAVARELSLPDGPLLTGPELDAMDDATLAEQARTATIFARVVPIQKLRLVEALRRDREVVAMTGDGVNDAPALKAADIGIAMGARGTDVARESAALVLVDDDFGSIVAAVRMGRRVVDNLQKALSYIVAVHVPIAGMSLLPVLFGWPLMLHPVHVVFLELIIDPSCSIVFEAEPEEPDVMRRPPRSVEAPLFGGSLLVFALAQGLTVLGVVALVYWWSGRRGIPEDEARALAFVTMVLGNLAVILVNRSLAATALSRLRTPNRALWWVVAGAFVFLAVSLYVPDVSRLFRFAAPNPLYAALAAAAGALSVTGSELWKLAAARGSR
ncbi:MAG: cation-translocating P-type ATPase [Sorangiineae bacterium]|nr:cation-translocating P-type ATPase [Polyangiaceae bacterium]MEB2322568.1 cation-translocating P-type ATPase [Sorangiineae bacterium]